MAAATRSSSMNGTGARRSRTKIFPRSTLVGRQEGVGSAARGCDCIARGIDHKMLGRVAGADAAHISDVVVQRGQNGMAPIAGRDDPLEETAAQNVLDAEG